MKIKLDCFIDGDCLCVVKKGFTDLQNDDAVFVALTPRERAEIDLLID